MNNEQEIWKDVEGYEGKYQVSNLGRVRSRKFGEWRAIHPSRRTDGYQRVVLSVGNKKSSRYVHCLVRDAFGASVADGLTLDGQDDYSTAPASMEGEEWRDVAGYEGRYKVSNLGRVMSVTRRTGRCVILRPAETKGRGSALGEYKRVVLCDNNKKKMAMVHRLVAMAFVSGYGEGLVVNHKDENPQNNRADNLEWVTPKENLNYATAPKRLSEKIRAIKARRVAKLTLDGSLVAEYPTITEACRSLGVKGNYQIRRCCNGERTDYRGYRWQWI